MERFRWEIKRTAKRRSKVCFIQNATVIVSKPINLK